MHGSLRQDLQDLPDAMDAILVRVLEPLPLNNLYMDSLL